MNVRPLNEKNALRQEAGTGGDGLERKHWYIERVWFGNIFSRGCTVEDSRQGVSRAYAKSCDRERRLCEV